MRVLTAADTRVGFIGLGRMGGAMASNVVRAGFGTTVFDVEAKAVEPLVRLGARRASSVGDVVRASDVVLTSLPGPPEIDRVMRQQDGILANLREGLVVFDLSTSSTTLARRLAQEFSLSGATFLDAPVSGGPSGAESGQLVVWVGGPEDVFDAHRPVLEAFSAVPRRVGEVGAGTVTKLAHNSLGYMFLQAMAESFSLATRAGIDPLDLWEALKLGVIGKQSALDMLVRQFLPGSYDPPAFALRLALKDMTLATALGRELGVPMRMAGLTLAEMTEALTLGLGDEDSRAYLKLQLARSGVDIAVDEELVAAAVERARQQPIA